MSDARLVIVLDTYNREEFVPKVEVLFSVNVNAQAKYYVSRRLASQRGRTMYAKQLNVRRLPAAPHWIL